MKLLIQHRLADAAGAWGDYLRLSGIAFLQLREEAYAHTLAAQPEYRLLYLREGTLYLVRNRVEAMYAGESLLLLPPAEVPAGREERRRSSRPAPRKTRPRPERRKPGTGRDPRLFRAADKKQLT